MRTTADSEANPDHPLSESAARAWLNEGLRRHFAEEADLMRHVAERAQTNRLLVHLDSALRDGHPTLVQAAWSVDSEYNRLGDGRDPKALPSLMPTLEAIAVGLKWDRALLIGNRKTDEVFPDYLLHRRKSGAHRLNSVVCEVKFSDESLAKIAIDVAKLVSYRVDLGYDHAFMILLGEDESGSSVVAVGATIGEGVGFLQALEARRSR